ncbi:MAG: hypothetical protein GTO40_31030, partial [Deltaproteobacteria bacterium]|nr:hypothetical protein [Deltaproteobacteria bacterium]
MTLQTSVDHDHTAQATQDFDIKRAYNTLSGWEDDRDGSGARDLVSENAIEVAVCYKDGPMNDTVIIDGFTTGRHNYVKIWVPSGQRHDGTADSGSGTDGFVLRYQYSGTSGQRLFQIDDEYVRVEGIEVDGSQVNSPYVYGCQPRIVDETLSDIRFDKILVHDLTANTTDDQYGAQGIYFRTGSGRVTNSIIYNIRNTNPNATANATGIRPSSSGTVYLYNNTVYNVSNTGNSSPVYGIWAESGTVTATNNYVGGTSCSSCGAENYDFSGGMTQDYNISEDTTATGSNSQTGKAPADQFKSITPGSEDLH